MKKFLVSVLWILACSVFSVANAEMYLFWRITDKPAVDLNGLQAHIIVNQGGFMQGLETYVSHDAETPLQESPTAFDAQWDMVARVAGYESASFFVELFNDQGGVYQSDALTYSELLNYQYISSMAGMTLPSATWDVKNFHVVPEPTSGLLLLIGVAGLALRRRKMKKA